MSKIYGVTVGTPMSVNKIKEKIKPITSVNGVNADENGNVEVNVSVSEETVYSVVEDALEQAKASGEFDGKDGSNGATFTPRVDANGNLSWTNNGGLTNPSTVNIKGKDGNDGDDGVSPTVSVANITGGKRITITDKNGSKQVDVMDGKDGDDGDKGADGVGIQSVRQTTTSSADGGTNIVTVTLTNGTTSTFSFKNGSKGSDGAAGKTPVRGTDYWTAADIAEIKSYVDDAILGGAW